MRRMIKNMKPALKGNAAAIRFSAALLIFVLSSALLSLAWSSNKPRYLSGVDKDGNKVYAGKVPIQETYAYQQFKWGSHSEASKLSYFLSRLLEMKDIYFRYHGKRYNSKDAYYGVNWLIRHRYGGRMNARAFIREQAALFQKPGHPLLIEFPDGAVHHLLPVVMNELDLLEKTYRDDSV